MTAPADRRLLVATGLALPALLLAARPARAQSATEGATEDLMVEHGVIRRILGLYEALAQRLRGEGGRFDPAALRDLAELFARYAQDHHQKRLEEEQVFPLLERQGGPLAALTTTLRAQHQRGREITRFVLEATRTGLRPGAQQPLANALDSLVRMFHAHLAREDTEVFPAFRQAISVAQYRELGERFQQIEQQEFGADGAAETLKRVQAAEAALGLAELERFTAPPPLR